MQIHCMKAFQFQYILPPSAVKVSLSILPPPWRLCKALTEIFLKELPVGSYLQQCCTSGPFNQAGWFGSVCNQGQLDGDTGEHLRDSGFSSRGPRPKYTAVCESVAASGSFQVVFKWQKPPDVWFPSTFDEKGTLPGPSEEDKGPERDLLFIGHIFSNINVRHLECWENLPILWTLVLTIKQPHEELFSS